MENEIHNILIIKMSSLGDIIHALPSLYVLRRHFPKAHITWAVHPAFAGILPGKPWIDEVYIVDRKKIHSISYLKQVRKDLHALHPDLVIDLQMIAKSALISFLSGGSRRIGYWDAREGSFLASHPIAGPHKNGHIIEQLLDVMRYLGCDVPSIEFPFPDLTAEKASTAEKLHAHGVHAPFVVLVPGTRGENKKWPLENYGALADRLARDGIVSVLAGSASERDMGRRIMECAPDSHAVSLMGETSLLELAALEQMAAVHVSSDTGPLHIANAMKTPLVALFGPTLPERSGPYGNPEARVLLADNPGHADTNMGTITVERVYNEVKQAFRPGEHPFA